MQCREAIERRDRLIEQLASMEPVQGALDQIVQRFGTDMVAEVTGRSRRIVRRSDATGDRFAVENRPAHANLAEAQAFMEDRKQILVFSDAGGTGRSYHADLGARNQRLRHHYLLEAGWKADAAIQGLGRTNRTNQAQPPLFRPVATNVQAEKRFLSTIARRLDTLGAITRGQRQTGGQGLFRPEDNLESPYARDALRQLYVLIYAGKVEHCALGTFESMTGLKLTDGSGCLKDELPPITTFLNRLLALTIAMQNILFTVFEQLLSAKVESAIAAGSYDLGLETLVADSFTVASSEPIYVHPATGAETRLLTIAMRERNQPVSLGKALDLRREPGARLLVNARPKRAAVQLPARSVMLDDGEVERRIRLIRPMERLNFALAHLARPAGRKWTNGPSPQSGKTRSRRLMSSRKANCISSPGCCCRSGSSCLKNLPASTGSRPTMAPALSGAESPRHGQRARWSERTRWCCRRRRHSRCCAKAKPCLASPMGSNCAVPA